MTSKPLWNHQHKTLELLETENRVLDASDPGTGKTRGAVESFAARRRAGGKKALIIAPKTLLQSAWGDDIDEYTPDITYICAYANNREEAFGVDADIYITNTDATKWLAKQKSLPVYFREFDTLIIDELSSFKHRTSQRSKALNKLKRYFTYREGLTGTPNSNTITDLWHQMFVLDDGQRLGINFFQFRNSVCEPTQVGPRPDMVKWHDKPGAELVVASMISDCTVRHKFEDCMDIPENFMYTVDYEMSRRNWKQYKELEETAILELKSDDVMAVNAAVLSTKLLQVASGAVYAENSVQILDTARVQLVLDLIEQRDHSVVFFNWTHQKDQLINEAMKRGVNYEVIDGTVSVKRRESIVRAYQAGAYQTLFLHPQTGAHGLTLTRGTATIWASPIYQADFLKQGMHRIYRGGQTEKTETILIQARGTIEEHVYSVLNEKNAKMVNLLEMLE